MSDIVERLRRKSAMITAGEKIGWGSDTAIMGEAASEIERLRGELDDRWSALSISDSSINAIRSMLRAGGVPEAPFIDDHVRNAIVQRNNARSAALEEAAKVADARARVSRLADKPSQLIHVSMTLAQFEAEAIATAIRALMEGAKP